MSNVASAWTSQQSRQENWDEGEIRKLIELWGDSRITAIRDQQSHAGLK